MTSLSERGHAYLQDGDFEQLRAILGDPYDRDTNPNGLVNLGTAENVRFVEPMAS